jgi:hypothetical protein
MKALSGLAVLGLLLSGCKSSGDGEERAPGEGPKRPPKVATLYVESSGEPLNAGGKTVEVADADGTPKGGFKATDLLMPGMMVLVSGATALGGALLVKAVDKRERARGPMYVETGGSEGTFAAVDTAAAAPPGGSSAPAGVAPDPGAFTAVASSGEGASSSLVASGTAVVATPTSILLSMGYATGYTGPSWVKVKSTYWGPSYAHGVEWHNYTWELTLDRTAVTPGESVDVFVEFSGLPAGAMVGLEIVVPGGAKLTVTHTPLVDRVPADGLGSAWFHRTYKASLDPLETRVRHSIILPVPSTPGPLKLGTLTVTSSSEIYGESSAVVTVS